MNNLQNPPAFPDPFADRDDLGHPKMYDGSEGMTLRDHFAAKAPPMPDQWWKDSMRKREDHLWNLGEASAAWAYFFADAMLEARAK